MKVTFDNINKTYFSLRGKINALSNISFDINEGEFFVLLGPSGCGKSTLLNLTAGLEKPSDGNILFNSSVVASIPKKIFKTPKERNVAFVFQSYALYPHLNVFENIAFPLRISRTKETQIQNLVKESSRILNITDLLLAKPAELSGGQRQRVAIARAIVRKPAIFLMDEPLSNLDARLRISMRSELRNLQKKLKITTLYVTHDQVEAMSLGDRIAILNNGKIEQIGTPLELYQRPTNKFVAGFIGSPPMNLLDGTYIEEQNIPCFFISGQKLEIPREFCADFKKRGKTSFTIGIRPEHITLNPKQSPTQVKSQIYSIEELGRDIMLHFKLGEYKLTALTCDTGFKEGQEVAIEFDFSKTHIF